MKSEKTEIDIISGRDFAAEKLKQELEEKGFKTKTSYIKFKKDKQKLKKDIKNKINSKIKVGHCYTATMLLKTSETKTIAIDPPNLEMKNEKVRIKPENKEKIITSEENKQEYKFKTETIPDSQHSFQNTTEKLANKIEEKMNND